MAHRLDGFDIDKELAAILEPYADPDDPEMPKPADLTLREKLSWLRSTVALVCGMLEGVGLERLDSTQRRH